MLSEFFMFTVDLKACLSLFYSFTGFCGIVPIYAYCPGMLFNNTVFYSQRLEVTLYGYPVYE